MALKFIYRLGDREKDLALTRPADHLTGLSFRDQPFGRHFLTLDVSILQANGFMVREDSGQKMTNIWTGEPFIEPNSGEQLTLDQGHVSVWHPDKAYWDSWYQADLQNKGKPDISKQLAYFAEAIVKGKSE